MAQQENEDRKNNKCIWVIQSQSDYPHGRVLPAYGVHQKTRRNRACLQFFPTFFETGTTTLES